MTLTDRQLARLDLTAVLPDHLDVACDRVLELFQADRAKTWTPSMLWERLGVATQRTMKRHELDDVISYLIKHAYVDHDERGAWTRYWLR